MEEQLQQVIALLPKLSPAEIDQVQSRLKFLRTYKEAPVADDLSSDWVMSGVITYLSRRGVMVERGAWFAIKKRTAYKVYLNKLPRVMCYLAKVEEKAKTRTRHRPALAYICAKALGEYLDNAGIFSVSTMLSNIDKIPEAIDKQFPGYVMSEMFGFVLDQLEARRK